MRVLVSLLLILSGCTSYGGAIEANWISQKTLKISGRGNGYTTDGRIEDYVMLKASEKAIESGYHYFILTNSENTGGVESYTVNGSYHTTVNARTYEGFYGPSRTYATATTTGGPQTYNIYKPGRDSVFVMFDERPKGYRPGQYFEAVTVYNELGPKYLRNFQPRVNGDIGTSEASPIAAGATEFVGVSSAEVAPVSTREARQPIHASAPPELPTLDEIYRSLTASERSQLNSMPPGDRASYLEEIRSQRY